MANHGRSVPTSVLSMWIRTCIQTCFGLTTGPILGELRAASAVWKADFQNCHLLFYSYTLAAVVFELSCPFCMFILGSWFCKIWPPLV